MGLIIGVYGYAGSGKDTSANIIQEILKDKWHISATNQKFAGTLKKCAGLILDVDPILFEDAEFKKKEIGGEYGKMTYREFLQLLGQEAAHAIHQDIWVISLFNKIKSKHNVIISDLRYPHEGDRIKEKSGIMINVIRPGVGPLNSHGSENAMVDYEFDYTVINDGTMTELEQKLSDVLEDYFTLNQIQ